MPEVGGGTHPSAPLAVGDSLTAGGIPGPPPAPLLLLTVCIADRHEEKFCASKKVQTTKTGFSRPTEAVSAEASGGHSCVQRPPASFVFSTLFVNRPGSAAVVHPLIFSRRTLPQRPMPLHDLMPSKEQLAEQVTEQLSDATGTHNDALLIPESSSWYGPGLAGSGTDPAHRAAHREADWPTRHPDGMAVPPVLPTVRLS